jgi:hypothetical protein
MASMPLFMGFMYAAIAALLLLYCPVFFYFKRREDSDSNKLVGSGFYFCVYGIIIRVFPIIMKLAHYGVLILIGVQAMNVFTGVCESPYYLDENGIKKNSQVVSFATWTVFIQIWFWVRLL